MFESHQRIVMMFNHLCKKDIPYRSAAVADFALGTLLDDTQNKMMEIDDREMTNLQKSKLLLEEHNTANNMLESLLKASRDKLNYVKNQRGNQQSEKELLQV